MQGLIAVKWSRRGSWHLAVVDSPKTLCGRSFPNAISARATLPGNEKTCERCLWKADAADVLRVSDVPEPVASEQDDYRGAAPV